MNNVQISSNQQAWASMPPDSSSMPGLFGHSVVPFFQTLGQQCEREAPFFQTLEQEWERERGEILEDGEKL
jgi:hypothetical protein